jgi:hypothetical protein
MYLIIEMSLQIYYQQQDGELHSESSTVLSVQLVMEQFDEVSQEHLVCEGVQQDVSQQEQQLLGQKKALEQCGHFQKVTHSQKVLM